MHSMNKKVLIYVPNKEINNSPLRNINNGVRFLNSRASLIQLIGELRDEKNQIKKVNLHFITIKTHIVEVFVKPAVINLINKL